MMTLPGCQQSPSTAGYSAEWEGAVEALMLVSDGWMPALYLLGLAYQPLGASAPYLGFAIVQEIVWRGHQNTDADGRYDRTESCCCPVGGHLQHSQIA